MTKDIICPECKQRCRYSWQKFSNGKLHIKRSCKCGGYAPQVEPFISYADENELRVEKNWFE
jgi:hypothetical protein